ncbi:DUF732 domain-containing protein [Prescottella agglutinans]|uniref:DUF732 domain-containing protein n=1 Tax=Prescottella agglutinans TaxID=1644129 RepID=A0ABT6MJY5_9NOCA|nr:DUF732 domain-containing protein [Prescottella agglutinans]MDH6284629.1 hypothetical protein [Prescottella agglutinans]
MRTFRACAAAALASAALFTLAGCSDDKPVAGQATVEHAPTTEVGIHIDLAEQVYRQGLAMAFPPGYDAEDLVGLGRQACTNIQARGGIQPDDFDAMVEVARDLAKSSGNRYNETQYGFVVGLSATTFCADDQQGGTSS